VLSGGMKHGKERLGGGKKTIDGGKKSCEHAGTMPSGGGDLVSLRKKNKMTREQLSGGEGQKLIRRPTPGFL